MLPVAPPTPDELTAAPGVTLAGLDTLLQQSPRVHTITLGGYADVPAHVVSPVDAALIAARGNLQQHAPSLVRTLRQAGVIDRRAERKILRQASAEVNVQDSWSFNDPMAPPTGSRQLSLEELYTIYDFVPVTLPGTTLEILEQEIFDEDYLAGSIIERTAALVVGDHHGIGRYDTADVNALSETERAQEDAEAEVLEDWVANVNRAHTFKSINRRIVMSRRSLGNAYVEVLWDRPAGADRVPAGLQPTVTSTMRVMKGHRGFIQWVAGQSRWFNVYTPRRDDRDQGVRLWLDYWKQQGIDAGSDAFLASPLSRTLSSAMPVKVWNPHLSEVIHLKGEWLRSNYYGFPRDYRLNLLWPILKYTLLYNLSYQRNARIPPFVLLWHGSLDDATFAAIEQRFANLQGAANFGKTLLLQTDAAAIGTSGAVPKTGLEILRITDDKDGVFLPLWEKTERNHAMHYAIPWDLIDTNNSNRASVIEALANFDALVGRDLRAELEQDLYQPITRIDLGLERRYLEFPPVDADDRLLAAQIHDIYLKDGVLNANETRADLGRTPRVGGDLYKDFASAGWTTEDEVTEAGQTQQVDSLERAQHAADTSVGGEGENDD